MLRYHRSSRTNRRWYRDQKIVVRAAALLGALMIFSAAVVIPGLSTKRHGAKAKTELLRAQTLLEDQEFSAARQSLAQARTDLQRAQQSFAPLHAFQGAPFLGTQVRALRVILDVGINLTEALGDGVRAAEQIFGPLQQGRGEISLATLTPADKQHILERFGQASPLLESVNQHIAGAVRRFRDLPERGLLPPLNALAAPVKEQLPFLEDTVAKLIPATQIIPAIVGFPEPKTYLFLLQNNSELRPTGGFIGTYGILKVNAGEIVSFSTQDVYTLDRPVRNTLFVEPPAPLRRYNATTQWFFRDSNWSPDFPTAAAKALEFYRLERGPERNIDGVIAVTPTFISSLLRLSGQITVDGITFTPDNLVDRLQPLASRKELIGEMSKILLNRILALPQRRWQELVRTLVVALEEKHMLLYAQEHELEQKILAQHWGGELQALKGDGLMVVDANLASLKTDTVVNRSLTYDLEVTSQAATATLMISYTNSGAFTKTTTRYRTYVRIYVPRGSSLISSTGAMANDKLHGGRSGTIDVSEELGRTVFGGFISIEPGETQHLNFTYALPADLHRRLQTNDYTLTVQKQPGTQAHALTAKVKFDRPVKLFTGVDEMERIGHTGVALTTDLRRDRHLTVTFSSTQ